MRGQQSSPNIHRSLLVVYIVAFDSRWTLGSKSWTEVASGVLKRSLSFIVINAMEEHEEEEEEKDSGTSVPTKSQPAFGLTYPFPLPPSLPLLLHQLHHLLVPGTPSLFIPFRLLLFAWILQDRFFGLGLCSPSYFERVQFKKEAF